LASKANVNVSRVGSAKIVKRRHARLAAVAMASALTDSATAKDLGKVPHVISLCVLRVAPAGVSACLEASVAVNANSTALVTVALHANS